MWVLNMIWLEFCIERGCSGIPNSFLRTPKNGRLLLRDAWFLIFVQVQIQCTWREWNKYVDFMVSDGSMVESMVVW